MGKAEGEAGYAPAAETEGLSRKGDWSWTGREFVRRADSRPTRLSSNVRGTGKGTGWCRVGGTVSFATLARWRIGGGGELGSRLLAQDRSGEAVVGRSRLPAAASPALSKAAKRTMREPGLHSLNVSMERATLASSRPLPAFSCGSHASSACGRQKPRIARFTRGAGVCGHPRQASAWGDRRTLAWQAAERMLCGNYFLASTLRARL